MKKLKLLTVLVGSLAGLMAFAGVAIGSHTGRRALIPITYVTSFGSTGREAYAYAALDQGYFKQAGFDVTIVPGSGSFADARIVAAGQAAYGVADPLSLAIARGNDALPVKVVACPQQTYPSGVFVLRGSGITQPTQFEGKKMADTAGSAITALLPYYAKKTGFDASKVTVVPIASSSIPSVLASGQVQLAGGTAMAAPLLSAAAGRKPVRFFPYGKYIKGLYGNCLFTSDSRVTNNPQQVRQFTNALLKGMRYAVDNPGKTGFLLKKYVPLTDPVEAAQEIRILKSYVFNSSTQRIHGIGFIDPHRIDSTVSIVNNFFKPTKRVTKADLYAPGFLPKRPITG